jgi:hypothetical protein
MSQTPYHYIRWNVIASGPSPPLGLNHQRRLSVRGRHGDQTPRLELLWEDDENLEIGHLRRHRDHPFHIRLRIQRHPQLLGRHWPGRQGVPRPRPGMLLGIRRQCVLLRLPCKSTTCWSRMVAFSVTQVWRGCGTGCVSPLRQRFFEGSFSS